MKLYIPRLGDSIKLSTDWFFGLYNESRNATLMEILGDNRPLNNYREGPSPITASIPAGEILKIDRIYIRKGNKDFDSVSFVWVGKKTVSRVETHTGTAYTGPRGKKEEFEYTTKIPAKPVRFWAKLDDVNNIEFEPV